MHSCQLFNLKKQQQQIFYASQRRKRPSPLQKLFSFVKLYIESKVIEQNKPATTVDKTKKPATTFN